MTHKEFFDKIEKIEDEIYDNELDSEDALAKIREVIDTFKEDSKGVYWL